MRRNVAVQRKRSRSIVQRSDLLTTRCVPSGGLGLEKKMKIRSRISPATETRKLKVPWWAAPVITLANYHNLYRISRAATLCPFAVEI